MYSSNEILIKKKIRYGYMWNIGEASSIYGVPVFCNIYIRDVHETKHRIDTVAIHNATDTFHVHYWFNTYKHDLMLNCGSNLEVLVHWINKYVMSNEGIKSIFQRFCTFDYYHLIRDNIFDKKEIITTFFNSEETDDDRV